MAHVMTVQLKTLTPLWTGGVDQKPDRLHETGLLGSLRWWYEALVRGLGGYACDPTDNDRCPDENGKHCAACELFGCTGWAREFRLGVKDSQGKLIQQNLERDMNILLEFVELRPIRNEEKWLLGNALKITADYGALGGRTTLKPQTKPKVGDDYGIVSLVQGVSVSITRQRIESYLRNNYWRQPATKLPDLRWFFFISGGFLWRRQMNVLLGQGDDGRPASNPTEIQQVLRGQRSQEKKPAESKRLFSFRVAGGRVWGYAPNRNLRDKIIEQIRQQFGKGKPNIKTGEEVLDEL